MTNAFAGRTVVITGAGSGIGRSMVELFREEGGDVLGVDIVRERLEALEADFPGVRTVVADISDPSGCDRIVAAAGDRIDVLCNNAGILDRLALIDEIDDETWLRVIGVNLTGTFLLTRRAVRKMIDTGTGGAIVNTSSTAAKGGGRAGPAYTASKAGVSALTKSVAVTCAEHGIRCNAILPGSVDTNMAHSAGYAELHLSERGVALLGRLAGKPAPLTRTRSLASRCSSRPMRPTG